jgi:hypothetical protein
VLEGPGVAAGAEEACLPVSMCRMAGVCVRVFLHVCVGARVFLCVCYIFGTNDECNMRVYATSAMVRKTQLQMGCRELRMGCRELRMRHTSISSCMQHFVNTCAMQTPGHALAGA